MPIAKATNRSGHPVAYDSYVVPFTAPADGSETDTGYDLPADGIVVDCYMIVDTAEAIGTTKTVDVGLLSSETNGDADGFLDGVSVAAAGFVSGSLASGGQTRGALIRVDESGAGVLVPEPLNLASVTARSVSVTAGSADFAELAARIVFVIARDPAKKY